MSSSALPAISVRRPSSDQPEEGGSRVPRLTSATAYSQSTDINTMNTSTVKPLPRIPRKPSMQQTAPPPSQPPAVTNDLSSTSSVSLGSSASATTTANEDTSSTSHTIETGTETETTPISSSSQSLLDNNANAAPVAPPLTRVHFSCYHYHRTFVPSRNAHCPLPCMTCLRADDKNAPRFRCPFCCLRICGDCVKGLQKCKDRSLIVFMEELVRMLESGGSGSGSEKGAPF